jgi:2-keto-3-deoxy-L-rhamnonate aldolase RhmA
MKVDEPVQADPEYRMTTVPPAVVPLMVNVVPAWGVDGVTIGVAHAPLSVTENTAKLRRNDRNPIVRLLCNTDHTKLV